MSEQRILPLLDVHGSYYHMGVQIGRQFHPRIERAISLSPRFQMQRKWDARDPARVNFVLEQSRREFPKYIEHLQGISDGAGISFRDLLLHNFMHMPGIANCSTSIIINPDQVCLCHNEDSSPLLGANSYFVKYLHNKNLKILSHCYPGILPGMSFGLNSHGIFMSTNALPDPYHQMGVPRILYGFHALHQRSIDKAALAVQKSAPRMGGANYNFLSYTPRKVINVETSSITARTKAIRNKFFHANHFIHEDFTIYPPTSHDSVARQTNGERYLQATEPTPENLLRIMRSKGVYLSLEDTGHESQTNGTLLVTTKHDMVLKYYPRDEPLTNHQLFSLRTLK